MARMAGQGFRAKVLGFDPGVDAATMRDAGVEKVDDLHVMLGACDFVSIHCVLNDDTRGLIGSRELACMKPSAILINVSRGAIIDEAALVEAIVGQSTDEAAPDRVRAAVLMMAVSAFGDAVIGPHVRSMLDQPDDAMRDLIARILPLFLMPAGIPPAAP